MTTQRIQPVKGQTYRREAAGAIVSAEADKAIVCRISDESVDRYGSTLALDGWNLANFEKNPVVLWAHNSWSLPPIAKATNTRVEKDGLYSEPMFAPTEFAQSIEQLVRGGFLNATSVGWSTEEWTVDEKSGVLRFLKMELLEWSFVPIPGNANALVDARAAGINTDPVRHWAEETRKAIGIDDAELVAIARGSQKPVLFSFARTLGEARHEFAAPTREALVQLVGDLDKRDDDAPETVACPGCDTQQDPSDKFCSACGTAMKEEAPPADDQPAEDDGRALDIAGIARAATEKALA
jgi:HK97 family phage prohead protease